MPLEILLILVVGGIGAIALLLHLTGRSRLIQLDEEAARAAWLRQFPDLPVQEVLLAQTHQAALITTATEPQCLGLVWSFGADTVARDLQAAEVQASNGNLRIEFKDFAAPHAHLRLPPREAEQWQQRIANQFRNSAARIHSSNAGTQP